MPPGESLEQRGDVRRLPVVPSCDEPAPQARPQARRARRPTAARAARKSGSWCNASRCTKRGSPRSTESRSCSSDWTRTRRQLTGSSLKCPGIAHMYACPMRSHSQGEPSPRVSAVNCCRLFFMNAPPHPPHPQSPRSHAGWRHPQADWPAASRSRRRARFQRPDIVPAKTRGRHPRRGTQSICSGVSPASAISSISMCSK